MGNQNNYYETGSNPCYLNLNNSAKDFSSKENTHPSNSFLDLLSRFVIVEQAVLLNPDIPSVVNPEEQQNIPIL